MRNADGKGGFNGSLPGITPRIAQGVTPGMGGAGGGTLPHRAASSGTIRPAGEPRDEDSVWHEHGWGLQASHVGLIFLTILAASLLLRLLGVAPGW